MHDRRNCHPTGAATGNAATTATTDAATDNAEATATDDRDGVGLPPRPREPGSDHLQRHAHRPTAHRHPEPRPREVFDLTSGAAVALTLRIKEDATGSGIHANPSRPSSRSREHAHPDSRRRPAGRPARPPPRTYIGRRQQATVLWPGWDPGHRRRRIRRRALPSPTPGQPTGASTLHIQLRRRPEGGHRRRQLTLAPDGDGRPAYAAPQASTGCSRAPYATLTVEMAPGPRQRRHHNAVAPTRTYTIDVADEATCLRRRPALPPAVMANPAAPAPGVGPGSTDASQEPGSRALTGIRPDTTDRSASDTRRWSGTAPAQTTGTGLGAGTARQAPAWRHHLRHHDLRALAPPRRRANAVHPRTRGWQNRIRCPGLVPSPRQHRTHL